MGARKLCVVVGVMLGLVQVASAAPPIEACHDIDTCLARCAKGTALACVRAGELQTDLGQSERKEATTTKIDAALGKACDKGNGRACFVGGDLHCNAAAADGQGGYGNCDATANARFQKGCTAGDGASCAFVGMLSHLGIGGENKDATRAKEFFAKAWTLLDDGCNAGKSQDCFAIGLYRASDRFGTADAKVALDGLRRAVPLFARDCDAGDGRACAMLFLFYDKGLAVTANADRAAELRKRLCKLSPKSMTCKEPTVGAVGVITSLKPPSPLAPPTVSIGAPAAQGTLDKEIIRRYIKLELPKFTYCYEKQLATKPNLAGTVMVKFTIDPTGAVSSSVGSGLDAKVDTCVADVVKTIKFPAPQGGGYVQVNYPFAFKAAGQPAPAAKP